jgi:Cu/Ag efflux pump CusA
MAVRNSLTLVSHYRNLEDAKGGAFDAEIVRQATRERSGPILMSAIATALVMLPMALLGSIAGLEIVRPMAVVILGGLVTSTLLSLFGVPAMYILFGARREPDLGLEAVTVVSATEVQGAMS